MTRERQAASKEHVEQVVAQPGVRFLRESLCAQQEQNDAVRIGSTHRGLITNLPAARDGRRITEASLQEWIAYVEGFGNQHAELCALGGAPPPQALWSPQHIPRLATDETGPVTRS